MIDFIALQNLAAELSARIIRSNSEFLDEELLQSLARLIPMVNADRGGLILIKEDAPVAKLVSTWYADGVSQVSHEVNLAEMFPWTYAHLVTSQRILACRTCDDLPSEAHVDRRSHELIGNKSFLIIPLPLGARVHHLLVLNTVYEEQVWPEEVVRLLQMLGVSGHPYGANPGAPLKEPPHGHP